jgi:Spy/CpxP family protein refolding chaperone
MFDAPERPVARTDHSTESPSIMTSRIRSRVAAAAAAALIGVAGLAGAQAFHRGHHGGGDVVMGIAALKDQLNLNTAQQAQWDSAVAAGKAARESGRTAMQNVHTTLQAELAKAEPDLAAVAAAADAARNTAATAHRQARDAWLNLYNTFSPDQKAVVKAALQKRLARMEKMRQRHSQGG